MFLRNVLRRPAAAILAALVAAGPAAASGECFWTYHKQPCSPCCLPSFGYYPTTWRPWPIAVGPHPMMGPVLTPTGDPAFPDLPAPRPVVPTPGSGPHTPEPVPAPTPATLLSRPNVGRWSPYSAPAPADRSYYLPPAQPSR